LKKPNLAVSTLTRHCNEMLILASLKESRMHGYQLAQHIGCDSEHYFTFNHGTLYPILHKLEKSGLIKGTWKQEEQKRKRKYYLLTSTGKKYLQSLEIEWEVFFEQLKRATGGAKK